jgi:hypothetical protein
VLAGRLVPQDVPGTASTTQVASPETRISIARRQWQWIRAMGNEACSVGVLQGLVADFDAADILCKLVKERQEALGERWCQDLSRSHQVRTAHLIFLI